MTKELAQGYYVSEKQKLIKQYQRILVTINPILVKKFGEQTAKNFQEETLLLYSEEIIPEIPYIGGNKNPYTRFLLQTSMALALYRSVQNHGGTLEEAAELIFEGMCVVADQMPRFFMHLYGRLTNSRIYYPKLRRDAQATQLRKYPADWVYSFVEGDGESFDYGIEMQECGILKFLEAQGAIELGPYLCEVDYITFSAMGIELRRTKTLAFGCGTCDFRMIVKGNPRKPDWPPRFQEKNCGELE